MQSTDVRIFWTCRKPSKKEVKVCEQLITKAAEDKDMVIAVIRCGVHGTTTSRGGREGDKRSKDPHITGWVLHIEKEVGYSLHYYVDETGNAVLDTPSAPNPQFWILDRENFAQAVETIRTRL